MEDDEAFAKKLKTLMDELKSDKQIEQIIIEHSKIQGGAEIGSVEQTTTRDGSVTQKVVTGVEVGKDLKIGNVKQQTDKEVAKDEKEAFIEELVEFEDGCGEWLSQELVDKGFYEYRAYFLAAAGIAEFEDCSRVDEISLDALKFPTRISIYQVFGDIKVQGKCV